MDMSRFRVGAVALLIAVSLASGCGGGSSDSGSTSAGSTSGTSGSGQGASQAARADLNECLRSRGVEVPDGERLTPGELPGGVDEDAFREAMAACRADRPEGSGGSAGGGRLQGFLACLRDEGVDVPEDAQPGAGLSEVDTSSPKFREALEACGSKRSGAGGQGGLR
jgi:hypothetical protein